MKHFLYLTTKTKEQVNALRENDITSLEHLIAFVFNDLDQEEKIPHMRDTNAPPCALYIRQVQRVCRNVLRGVELDIGAALQNGALVSGGTNSEKWVSIKELQNFESKLPNAATILRPKPIKSQPKTPLLSPTNLTSGVWSQLNSLPLLTSISDIDRKVRYPPGLNPICKIAQKRGEAYGNA
jgi:hypothetical protein